MKTIRTKLAKKEHKRNQLKSCISRGINSLLETIETTAPERLAAAKAIILCHGNDTMNTTRRLREIIDEMHCVKQGKRAPLHLIPHWPTLSEALNENVTANIFSFLDDESFNIATKVSRSFHEALIPRQRKVFLSSFPSFENFVMKVFAGMVSFSGRNSDLLTDAGLHMLASYFPKLTRIDISGCRNITLDGVIRLVVEMGPRLKGLTMDCFRDELTTSEAVKALGTAFSRASSLESLSLTLDSPWCECFSLSCLNGSKSLRELSVMCSGVAELPWDLPCLKILKLEMVDPWRQLQESHYPCLIRLELISTPYPLLTVTIDSHRLKVHKLCGH